MAVSAQTIINTVSTIQGKQVVLEETGGSLAVSSQTYKTAVRCVPKEDFLRYQLFLAARR